MIGVRDLSFGYRPEQSGYVIEHLDHVFPSGLITAVTGPSGCGKSTLLYLLGLMLTPNSGSVTWNNTPLSALSDRERSRFRARSMGFVFQDAVLDSSRTVLDNVIEGALFASKSRSLAVQRALSLLEHFSVEARADHRPGEISGGQAQRVALCRALVKKPKVILADEPTGNLDHDSASVVWDALRSAADVEDVTVIVATHNLQFARIADRVLELGGVI